ncbi:MAG: cytochrome c maturation protein CcmE [Armatimonadetes bacterium]|nr:cytochrome c maturation protein CcmE [Armatimonadota bacterium]
MNKSIYILAALVIAGFAVLGMLRLIEVQTPYVTLVSEARSFGDRPIRFEGAIVAGQARYDDTTDELLFQLRDTVGDTLWVRYKGLKPAGFDRAQGVVVRGKLYGNEIYADQIDLSRQSE